MAQRRKVGLDLIVELRKLDANGEILRGAGEAGLPSTEIGARMLTHSPDTTRLLDKLEARELVLRTRSKEDRRVVRVAITPVGLSVLRILDKPLQELHRAGLKHMAPAELQKLVELLEAIRAGEQRTAFNTE